MQGTDEQKTQTRAVAYIRVSTEQQAERGCSLEAQKEKIEAYCRVYDIELVATCIDAGISGKSMDRESLQTALGMLRSGKADALVVYKLDRLTRSVKDLGMLVDMHFRRSALLSVSEQIDTRTAGGRLVLNVLGSVAQWEREAIGERTSAALQHMRSKGLRVGGVPYGWRLSPDGETLAEDKDEQYTRAEAKRMAKRGKTLRGIAASLAERGMVSRTGKVFLAVQIQRMIA